MLFIDGGGGGPWSVSTLSLRRRRCDYCRVVFVGGADGDGWRRGC